MRPRRRRCQRSRAASFDDFVGADEDRLWHGEAERLGGLEIDNQLECGRLLDRQIGALGVLENLPGVDADLTVDRNEARPVVIRPPAAASSRHP
jgi:hypothetical protein